MRKETLYMRILPFQPKYQRMHARTAELDFAIIQKAANRKTVVQIAMEIPCAEATVYRAINRVSQFLTDEEKLCQVQSFQIDEKEKE